MTLEQIRKRLAEISASLGDIKPQDGAYSEEQVENINALNEEFEGLETQLSAAEKIAAVTARANASAGRRVAAAAPAVHVEVGASGTDRFGGFKSGGDFLMAVKRAGQTGEMDKRFKNTAYEKVGEDGGFLVPDEMVADIQTKLDSQESLLARCTQFPVSGNSLTFPIDENQPWNQGCIAYWTAEGAPITTSKNALGQATYRLHKLAAMVPVTDELLDDATAMEGYIRKVAPAAIMHKTNKAIISGTGAGQPMGILNSGHKAKVLEVDGQDGDTIVAGNVLSMYAAMLPGSRANAVWLVAAGIAEAQLMGLTDGDGRFLYIAQGAMGNTQPFATLLGRPVIPMMSGLSVLGDEGDLIFVDLAYYYAVVKSGGIKATSSIHLYFDRDITAFKFTMRIDGSCPYKSPVTTEAGDSELSAIVTVENRT